MELFVTGASGLLGSAFVQIAVRRGHQVMGVAGRTSQTPASELAELLTIDLTNADVLRAAVRARCPDAIVNCAAVASPAECEQAPERSRALNVELPRHLAQLARELNARLIHLSSEQVFDGESPAAYSIADRPNPINQYGRHKAESERAVAAEAGDLTATVRPPLLLGNSLSGTRSLPEQMLAAWAAGKELRLYADEFRQPCTTGNLAAAMLELCNRRELTGIFHWAGIELVSRYDLACRLRDHFGLSPSQASVTAITRAETPGISRIRPRRLELDLRPLPQLLATQPESLAQQFRALSTKR